MLPHFVAMMLSESRLRGPPALELLGLLPRRPPPLACGAACSISCKLASCSRNEESSCPEFREPGAARALPTTGRGWLLAMTAIRQRRCKAVVARELETLMRAVGLWSRQPLLANAAIPRKLPLVYSGTGTGFQATRSNLQVSAAGAV